MYTQGIGSTTVMISSHSMSNDLVGEHAAAKGGFVYGAFSLTDKCVAFLMRLLESVSACVYFSVRGRVLQRKADSSMGPSR